MLEKSVHDCKCLILFRNFFALKNVAASSIPLLQSFALLSSQFLWTKLLAMGLTRRKVFDSYGKNVIAQYSCKTDFSPVYRVSGRLAPSISPNLPPSWITPALCTQTVEKDVGNGSNSALSP
jgi:hypothetical protein